MLIVCRPSKKRVTKLWQTTWPWPAMCTAAGESSWLMLYPPLASLSIFAGPGSDERTLYHEATHQLFHESRPVAPEIGLRTNFWIIEGIAMYMESLHQEAGFHVLGGFEDVRVQNARYRLLKDGFYVPLREFSNLGMHAIQNDKRIVHLYSQAAALTHFLIHYDGGRYRDALVAYLTTVYTGRDTLQTLPQLTGASFAELDAQFRQFITAGSPSPAEKK